MPIRLRVALVFALALAIAFALGGWLFISQLSAAMLRSTDSALAARLSQVSRDPEGETAPVAALPPGGPAPGEYIAQVVDASGRVRRVFSHAGTTWRPSGAWVTGSVTAKRGERCRSACAWR